MKKKIFIVLFAILMTAAMAFIGLNITNIVSQEESGLSAVINTNASSYKQDQNIEITVSVYNNTLQNFSNVDVQVFLPEELSQIRGNNLYHNIEVPSNSETIVTTKALVATDKNRDNYAISDKTDKSDATQSKETYTLVGFIIIAVLLTGITVCVIITIRNSKKAVKVLCIILSATLAIGIIPSAFFAYKDRDEIIYVEKTITVDGKDVEIVAKITKLNRRHSQRVEIELAEAMYDSIEDSYILFSEMPVLNGTLYNTKHIESAVCVVEDENGKELFKEEFSPKKEFTIDDFGMIVGVNNINFTITQKDGFTYEKTYVVNNLCEKNMENIDVDTGDTDKDGVLNFSEELYHTDPKKIDTDEDGLSDYQEMAVIGTDPKTQDTDNNDTIDSDEDTDGDGLINKDEIDIYSTNPALVDSDLDELTDSDEIEITHTNPNKKDTDDDGKSDKWELDNGFDPIVSDETFPKSEVVSDVKNVEIFSDGNAIITVYDNDLNLNNSTPGYVGVEPFEVELEDEAEAEITINYDETYTDGGEAPTLYNYDVDTQDFTPVENAVIANGVATATIRKSGVYILLNHRYLDDVWNTDILRPSEVDKNGTLDIVFVIDRSLSMDSNDPNDLRKKVTKEFIDKLRDDKDRAAIVQFTSVSELVMTLTSDKTKLKNTVDGIQNSDGGGCVGTDPNPGTNGAAGLREALNELQDSTAKYKYIIFLTDGVDTKNDEPYENITADARRNNVIIHTVGLIGTGDVDVDLLKKVAADANGQYFLATAGEYAEEDSENLEVYNLQEVYSEIEALTIDLHTDANNDGIIDYYARMICEGKLKTSGNIQNLFGDATYEEIQANDDYDDDGLKNGEEIQVMENEKGVYIKLNSYPFSKDSDSDGFSDPDEKDISMSPIRYNASALQDDINALIDDTQYISNAYLERYNSNLIVESAVLYGNAIFGSTFDQVSLYRKQLISYFESIDEFIADRQREKIFKDFLASLTTESLKLLLEVYLEYAKQGAFDKCIEINEAISDAFGNVSDIHDILDDFSDLSGKLMTNGVNNKFLTKFNTVTTNLTNKLDDSIFSLPENKVDDLCKGIQTKLSKTLAKLDLPPSFKSGLLDLNNSKFGKFIKSNNFDVVMLVVSVGIDGWENYHTYCDAIACFETMEENIYILECIINSYSSSNTYLRSAAADLKRALMTDIENRKKVMTDFSLRDTTQTAISETVHLVIGTLGVPGKIFELTRTILNLTLNLDGKSEAAANTVAMAQTSYILAKNFRAHLEGGYAIKHSKNWIAYSDYSSTFYINIINLALIRQYSEELMIDWEKNSEQKSKGTKNCSNCEEYAITYTNKLIEAPLQSLLKQKLT